MKVSKSLGGPCEKDEHILGSILSKVRSMGP